MSLKRNVRGRDMVDDIRAGMSDSDLMEKYKLSAAGLQSVFGKLVKAKAILPSEIFSRPDSTDDTVALEDWEQLPGSFTLDQVSISDQGNPRAECRLEDLTEKTFVVTGIEADVHEIKSFSVRADEFPDVSPFEFYGECLRTRSEIGGKHTAEFRITRIVEDAAAQLARLIHLLKLWPEE